MELPTSVPHHQGIAYTPGPISFHEMAGDGEQLSKSLITTNGCKTKYLVYLFKHVTHLLQARKKKEMRGRLY